MSPTVDELLAALAAQGIEPVPLVWEYDYDETNGVGEWCAKGINGALYYRTSDRCTIHDGREYIRINELHNNPRGFCEAHHLTQLAAQFQRGK